MAISSFLEAFQRVADMATNSKGKFTELVTVVLAQSQNNLTLVPFCCIELNCI